MADIKPKYKREKPTDNTTPTRIRNKSLNRLRGFIRGMNRSGSGRKIYMTGYISDLIDRDMDNIFETKSDSTTIKMNIP